MFEGTPQSQNATLPASPQVYTMPEKFMQPRKVTSGKTKKWLIIGSMCTAVVLVLIAIIVFAFQISSERSNENFTMGGGTVNVNFTAGVPNANSDSNSNTNALANTNTGTALNFNVNEALGNNINAGLFPNDNANANGNTNANGGNTLPDRSDVSTGRDKDRDGLTDVEEDLYETRFDQPDTDKDGYVDGTEVRNLFSPVEEAETLLESGSVIEYSQKGFGWSIYYPAGWIADPINDSKSEVLFASDTVDGEFVEVLVVENTTHETAAKWYASLYADVDPDTLEAVTVGGLQGIVSPDGFTYYLADDSTIIGIIYNFGTKTQVQFQTTFEMMVASFDYTPVEPVNTNTNSNTNS